MDLLEIPEPTPNTEIDEEITEIFIEEMEEVRAEIITSFTEWKENPISEGEALITIRRCFHTMKGSGRLVGAVAIGELGWRFESMLNEIINKTLTVNEEILTLIEQAIATIIPLVEQYQQVQAPEYEIVVLISKADYIAKHKTLDNFDAGDKPKTQSNQKITTNQVEESNKLPQETPQEAIEALNEQDDIIEDSNDVIEDSVIELDNENLEFDDLDFESEILDTDDLSDLLENDTFGTDDLGDLDDLGNLDDLGSFETDDLDDLNLLPELDLEIDDTEAELPANSDKQNKDDNSQQLWKIFYAEASQYITALKQQFANIDTPKYIQPETIRAFHTLNGISHSVELTVVSELASPLENYTNLLLEQQVVITTDIQTLFNQAIIAIENLINGQTADPIQHQTIIEQIQTEIKSLTTTLPLETTISIEEEPDNSYTEESDLQTDEFMSLFFEEAEEILENTQSLLERWNAAPENLQLMKELQRELHTLKGGARMVGVAPMGELSHHLESVLTKIVEGVEKSTPKIQEIIQESVDELAAMLAAVRSGVPLDMPEDLINQINSTLNDSDSRQVSKPKPEAPKKQTKPETSPTPETTNKEELVDNSEDRIRVRASLIDKLTNLAGELSISRSHMEQQQGNIKINLAEMEQTVIRLRDQLRRLEIETEAQIISHFKTVEEVETTGDEEFDLLELDRFSVMQQLSRSLMESVSDLTNIQDSIKNLTRQSDSLLIQQSRIGAELQEGIIRTRMVPFARISPRLQRIARLTARELHKQVDFIVNGEEIEFERTVLNRIIAPLEHMLRNAIDHGIEDANTRQKNGKSSVATIIVSLAREGAELVIRLRDDGAGLNLSKIRKKAEERGLIKPDITINDRELMQFILEHGFSTADKLTTTSGRGVGMDVVYSEIKQLSGSLRIDSKQNEGTVFEIRLPLSLTITQALLVQVGEETMAIPINHVNAVMRITPDYLTKDSQEHYYKYMGEQYQISYLGELLGMGKPSISDDSKQLIPALLIHVADRYIALTVDVIKGNKEIVVKSVGPQIGVIRWLAGATILGDGRVVLILDMPALTRIDTTTVNRITRPLVAEAEKQKINTIMIVDDSITVRKVTARFLKRQGMEVLTAKDGLDAITKLQEQIPDLMLLDVEMPRMDGYELATQIRNRDDLKHLPIIMITSRTGNKHRNKATKIGIDRYLGKPFNENELLENIHALLSENRTAT